MLEPTERRLTSRWKMAGVARNNSVIKAFALLKAFRNPEEWLTNSELARRAGVPEPSSHRLVQTLLQIGAVVRSPRGRYRPGMLLVSLSQKVVVGELLRAASEEIILELSHRQQVTAHLGMFEDGMVTYLAKATAPGSHSTHTRVGAQLEAYCSALGKVLLAHLSPDQFEDVLLSGELIALTPFTVTNPAALRAQLAEVRRMGFARDDREARIDIRCVAVPVHDGSGHVVAALSATEAADKMTEAREGELLEALQDAAVALRRKVFPELEPRTRPARGRQLGEVPAGGAIPGA